MRRSSRGFIISAALMAAFIVPVGVVDAATTVTYRLSGTASTAIFQTVSMSGTARTSTKGESGRWSAVFSQDIGAILIGTGTFTLTSKARTFSGAITGGTFGPGTGSCAKTTIPVHGSVAGGGSFDVTITRVGSFVNGLCAVTSSKVAGTATLVYP